MMQFLRDSDPVAAILAAAHPRPAEELITALRKGSYLRKHGRRGKPKNHWFRLSHDDRELLWDSSNGKVRSIPLLCVLKVVQGQTTPVFRRDPLPEYEGLSFSLLYAEGGGGGGGSSGSGLLLSSPKARSLDVVCRSQAEFEAWFLGIQLVICVNQNLLAQQQHLANGQAAAAAGRASGDASLQSSSSSSIAVQFRQLSGPLSPRRSEDRYAEIKHIAASLQPVKTMLGGGSQRATAAGGGSGTTALGALHGAGSGGGPGMMAGLQKREIGDCYIWGSWLDAPEVSGVDPSDGVLQACSVPVMVANTHALDITQVAVGAAHAALLTRGGEVYSWGAGLGGNMGNGGGAGSSAPQQVTRLAGRGTARVSCGHTYTAAVSGEGALFTWGQGLGGQLGLGPAVTAAVWPTRVLAGLEGVRVCQVSCGPYHAAAIGADGRLFTWGDGLFGKLGHGDHSSAHNPRFVTTLAEHWVVSVSCGWWHTAAAAVARARLTSRAANASSTTSGDSYASDSDSGSADDGSTPPPPPAAAAGAPSPGMRRSGSNSTSFLRGNIIASGSGGSGGREAAAAAALAARARDLGGAIFTWGGDFKWQQPWAKDTHQGCLGVGDLSGRLVPTLVKGEDNHVQVACGLNFTVALTNSGEVFQMGSTGATNNRERDKADWKNALVPVLVRGLLSSHVAQRLACGMSHVAVVATQRSKGGGHGSSGSGANPPVTRLLTWGQNGRGQLGIGEGREDHCMPQVVSAVAGRRILNLACGGNYTLAVCEHDPRAARWSRDSGADPDALLGMSSAVSGSLVSGSGPSRLHLSAAALGGGGGGSGGGPGPPSERGNGGAMPAAAGGVAAQRGGLPVSASYSSLASSVPSSRGEGGSGGGIASLSRRSERGRLEGRLSDRGFPVCSSSSSYHTAGAGSSGREQQHGPVSSSRSMGLLTRSLDRSLIGLGLAPGGRGDASGGPATSSSHASHGGTPGSDPRTVSWAPSPSGARCQRGAAGLAAPSGSHSSRGVGGGGGGSASSGPSLSLGQSGGLQDLSLSALASVAKRSHLPLPRSFKKLGGGAVLRHDSTHSSGSSNSRAAAGWGGSDWQQHHPYQQQQQQHYGGTPGRGQAGGGCRDAPWLVQGRSSYRQTSYTAGRSEPDLATVSITSSMTSAGLSTTTSPSLQSLQEGRAADAPTEGGGGPDAGSSEFQRQLRYWQERAANMEQQLSRKTHELDSMRREMRHSSTSQGTTDAAGQQQQQHSNGMRPFSSGGGGVVGGGSSSAVNLAVRRGLQPPPPVTGVQGLCDTSSDGLPPLSAGSSQVGISGRSTASAAATPGASSSAASSAAAAGVAAAAVEAAAGDAAATRQSAAGAALGRGAASEQQQQQQQQITRPAATPLGSFPLPADSASPGDEPSSSCNSMVDAAEEWAQAHDSGAAGGAAAGGRASPAAASDASAGSNGDGVGPVLHRGTSLANWMGLPAARQRGGLTAGADAKQLLQAGQSGADEDAAFAFVSGGGRQPPQSTGLEALREVLSPSAGSDVEPSPGVQSAPATSSSNTSTAGTRPPWQQQQQQVPGVELFEAAPMAAHSKEASRVLSLFQESHRHRQELEQQQQPGVQLSGNAGLSVAVPVAAAVGVAGSDASLSPAALRELQALREQNRLLQQQLQELQRQQQGAAGPDVAASVGGARGVVAAAAAARSSLAPSTGGGSGDAAAGLMKHRRGMSVDRIGANAIVTREVSPGVHLSLLALPEGGFELKRVRFAKQMFTSEDAEAWWAANREGVYAAYLSTVSAHQQQQQQQQQPSGDVQQQQPVNGGRPLVSLRNPHPLGPPLAELRLKRRSSAELAFTPGASPLTNSGASPHSSTLELDPFTLPPSTLLDIAFAEAAAVEAAGGAENVATQQRLAQLQQPRSWALEEFLPDTHSLRFGSTGGGLAAPDLAALQQQQRPDPVLLPGGPAAAASVGVAHGSTSGASSHKRSGSGLFRWLSRAGGGGGGVASSSAAADGAAVMTGVAGVGSSPPDASGS